MITKKDRVVPLSHIVTPVLFIKPPTVVSFETICTSGVKEDFDVIWLLKVHVNIASLYHPNSDRYRAHYNEQIVGYQLHADTISE